MNTNSIEHMRATTPVDTYIGPDSSLIAGSLLRERGVDKAMVICDKSLEAAAPVVRILECLREAGCAVVVYSGIRPEPSDEDMDRAAALCWENRCQAVVAVGGSEKGLAAAGVTVEKEAEHIRAVLEAAREQNIPILALHIGGYGRRGDVTDPLIQTVFPFADGAVILEEGDPDGLMLDLLNRADIPADYVAEPIDAVPVFQRIFRVAPGSGIPPEDAPGAGPDELPGISQAENS